MVVVLRVMLILNSQGIQDLTNSFRSGYILNGLKTPATGPSSAQGRTPGSRRSYYGYTTSSVTPAMENNPSVIVGERRCGEILHISVRNLENFNKPNCMKMPKFCIRLVDFNANLSKICRSNPKFNRPT